MQLCTLPPPPKRTELLPAYSILKRACESAESFVSAYTTVRKARNARGTATDHEQDLMRAALVFAAAGLDSCLKQLVRDTLRIVIKENEGAHDQFTDYVRSKLRRLDKQSVRFLAEAITAEKPTLHVQQQLVAELTQASVQSKDQILRVAAYFAIPSDEVSTDLKKLHEVFRVRNEIAHEMDILLGQPNRGRRQRRQNDMEDYAAFVLSTALAFYTAVENRLPAHGS